MTATVLLQRLCALGVHLTPSPDGTLRYKAPKGVLTPTLLDAMRQHKAELHALVEEWSERAAMAEYCGGLSREEAERVGWIAVLGTA
jgi:TubC N-terminal docking domain